MSLAPVVIFTFNRLEHTKKTIEALKNNILAKDTEVFIFSDGPRNEAEALKVESVREYIESIDGFKKINIFKAERNKGLANSVINGVTDIINKYGKVIVLEDDLITSKYFLEYMNKALDLYEDRKDIWSISGYTPNIKIPDDYKDEVYLIRRGSSWGWATWKNRLELTEWGVADYDKFKKNRQERRRFNEGGKDLAPMLDDQMEGRIDSWAIRWVYSQFKNDMWTVYPIKSFVKNIGADMSGTHTSITNKYDVNLINTGITLNKNVKKNSDICKSYSEFYNLSIIGYFNIIIKKLGLYKQARKLRNRLLIKIRR